MNKYLAKSDPKETIQQHTDKLIENYKLLKSIYEPILDVNWDILYEACLKHDLGKMNSKFQEKIEKQKKVTGEIPHGILSLAFIDSKSMKQNGVSKEELKVLYHAIAYHHERELNYESDELNDEVELLIKEFDGFTFDKLEEKYLGKSINKSFFIKNDRIYENSKNKDIFFKYVMVKGLLNRLDYAASGHIKVELKNDFLKESLEQLLSEWKNKKPGSKWNDLQEYMKKYEDENLVVIAQTGMGKTEAGLLWIGDNKGFFTLPLKTAINSIYDRVVDLVKENKEDRVGLLHSDTLSEYINRDEASNFTDYYNKTKQMSLPLTICTLDQIFDFVFKYRGFEPKLATLAYSKVIIDEIQMYSPDLLAYLIVGLKNISRVGGKFAILTATLPSFVLGLLEEEGVKFKRAEKAFINKELNSRHSISVIEDSIDIEHIKRLYDNNKVLVICNTVKKAQEIYKKLNDDNIENINLFHSGFIKKDRKEKEDAILKFAKSEKEEKLRNKEHGIWIATQVVEASLDIDFDILVTELSDINGLFQRLGRCHRNRNFNGERYNCYVYTGKCSGVNPDAEKSVIDQKIHELSKEAIKEVDGLLSEEDKISIIEDVYSYEKIKDTDYYKSVKDKINFINNLTTFENGKSDVKKKFRNIDSKNIIPKPIYEDNKEVIDSYITIISEKISHLSKEEKILKNKEKIKARNRLSSFIVSVRSYHTENTINISESLDLSDYEKLIVLDCDYSNLTGIEIKKKALMSNYEFL